MKTENKNKSTHDPVTETIQKQIFKQLCLIYFFKNMRQHENFTREL